MSISCFQPPRVQYSVTVGQTDKMPLTTGLGGQSEEEAATFPRMTVAAICAEIAK